MFGAQHHIMSDGDCDILGTVRTTNVDGMNRDHLKAAIDELKHVLQGACILGQSFDRPNLKPKGHPRL